MTLTADLYFSFRSPYSYLAIGRYRELSEPHNVDIALRTVLPIAIRDPDILFTGNPAFFADQHRNVGFGQIVSSTNPHNPTAYNHNINGIRQLILKLDRAGLIKDHRFSHIVALSDWKAEKTTSIV